MNETEIYLKAIEHQADTIQALAWVAILLALYAGVIAWAMTRQYVLDNVLRPLLPVKCPSCEKDSKRISFKRARCQNGACSVRIFRTDDIK